jgi:hypothetical protein
LTEIVLDPVTGILLCFAEVAGASDTLSRSDAARCKSIGDIGLGYPLAQLIMRKARQTISIAANSSARPGFPRRLFGIARRGAVAAAMPTSYIFG